MGDVGRAGVERAVVALLAASVLLLFLGLGANTIWDANEAFYVDTPRHMVETGDYVNPQFNGEPRMNKPVLSYWIVAGFYQVFGVSVGVERLAIAVGAVGILFAAFLFGRSLGGTTAGLLAALIVATAPRFVMFSRRIFIDIWVTMFMALALACFVLAEQKPDQRRRYLWLMYAAIGLGVLTKGPVALLFPAATIGTWLLLERRLSDLRRFHLVSGTLIVLAIVVPWWAVIYAQQGWEPLQAFWLGENVGRYTEAMQPGERDIFFYVPVVLGDLFPWTLFVVGGLVWGATTLFNRESPIARLLMLWVVWHIGVFSLSQTKQDLYIFPIVPALAALAACLIQHAITHGRMRVIRAGAVMSAALMAIVGGGLFWLLGSQAQIHQIAGANLLGVVLCGGAVVVVGLGLASRPVVALTAIAATLVVANYVFALVSLPAVEAFKPVLPMVQTIEARAAGRSEGEPIPPVAHYREVLPSMAFYLKRPIEDIFDMQTLVARVHQVPAMYIMMRPNHYAELQARAFPLDIPTCIISRHTLFEAKLKNVLSGEAWPQLLLVGTRAACAR
ncbi:MAG: glycosyltransferase family 39 protein [Acidimicrobiia bacterium]|nr:glycosyltransferase family 39 protein [Acidimicrobiia bacterium]